MGPQDSDFQIDQMETIREEIKSLAGEVKSKGDHAHALAFMACIFYEIEDAIAVGASQRDIHNILEKNGADINWTKFQQSLLRLRSALPQRIKPPKLCLSSVKKSSAAIKKLTHDISLADVQNDTRHDVSDDSAVEFTFCEKVQFAAAAVLQLATMPQAKVMGLSRQLRSTLGHGWNVKTTIQFVGGGTFKDWTSAPWSMEDGEKIKLAHQLALRLLGMPGGIPCELEIKEIASLEYNQLINEHQRAHVQSELLTLPKAES